MNKFLVGFVLGSLLSAALTYFVLRSESPVEAINTVAPNSPSLAEVPSSLKTSDVADEVKARSTNPKSSSSPGFASNRSTVNEISAPARQPPQSDTARSPVVPALPRSAITQSSNVFEPIPVSDAHRAIINGDPTFAQGHADLELQARDDAWSYYMEQMLGGYFASRTPGTGVEIVNIACRTTSCEILAYSEHGTGAFDVLWQRATKESWWDFVSSSGRSNGAQERVTIVMFLERAPRDRSRLPQPNPEQRVVPSNQTIAMDAPSPALRATQLSPALSATSPMER